MNKYLKNLNKNELEKHIDRLKVEAANDITKLSEGSYQRRFAEMLVKTTPVLLNPEFDLEQNKLPAYDPVAILQNANGFDAYVKNNFLIQAINREEESTIIKINAMEQALSIRQSTDEFFASKRNWFQRHFNVFRSRADKANASSIERTKIFLRIEKKYSDLLDTTHIKVNARIEEFENKNKDKLEQVNQRVDELRAQKEANKLVVSVTVSENLVPEQAPPLTPAPQVNAQK